MTETPSSTYYVFPEQIKDRISYGENNPERVTFLNMLSKSTQHTGYSILKLGQITDPVEEDVNPKEETPNEDFQYLGLGGIDPNTGKAKYLTLKGEEVLSKAKKFYLGDIVFSGLRPYLNKVHLVQIEEGIGSTELFVIRPHRGVVPEYLLQYLLSGLTLTQTKWVLTGCSYPRLNPDDFNDLSIVLPKPKEQEKILKKLEPLSIKIHEVEEKERKELDELRNVILRKLSIKMPSPVEFDDKTSYVYHDWSEINSSRLDFIYHHPWMNEIRSILSSLVTVELGSLIEPQIDFGVTASGLDEGNIPFINIDNLGSDGRLLLDEVKYINEATEDAILDENDILVSRSRLVGVCSLLSEKEIGYSFGSYILRLKPKRDNTLPPEYIVNFLNSDLGQAQFRMLETGAFGKNINTGQVKSIRVITSEKKEVVDSMVSEIKSKWKSIDELKVEAKRTRAEQDRTFINSILGID